MSTTINFNDIFKSSFLERSITSFSPLDVLLAIGISFLIGLFIYNVYRKTFSGVMYSKSFSISLIAMSMMTSLVILGVTSNVVLSLGMVGALSIVRFRTAVKDPMDIVYLFWSIGAGILSGAGLFPIAILGSLAIGFVLILFVRRSKFDNPYVLIVKMNNEAAETLIMKSMETSVRRYIVKSKLINSSGIELTLDVRLKGMNTGFINELAKTEGVTSAVLVSYDGEYAA
jgi:uncharacterized membrane protein YhiD involved in acid resistance